MRRILFLAVGLAGLSYAEEGAQHSADAYAACSACHLAAGEGIPGAFPPLRNRVSAMAGLDGGREYLISVVSSGLMGTMQADGVTYMGVMPGHQGSMSAEQIAAALNYVVFMLTDAKPEDVEAFSAAEVSARQSVVENPSPATAANMRNELLERHSATWPR